MGASGFPSFGSLLPSDPEDVPHGSEKTVFGAILLLAIGAALVDALVAEGTFVDAIDDALEDGALLEVVGSIFADGPPRKNTAAPMASTTATMGINARRSISKGASKHALNHWKNPRFAG
jgi:hypothetical protein